MDAHHIGGTTPDVVCSLSAQSLKMGRPLTSQTECAKISTMVYWVYHRHCCVPYGAAKFTIINIT